MRSRLVCSEIFCRIFSSGFKVGLRAKLSPASVGTLRLQGGVMSAIEAEAFEAEPFAEAALAVRGWDDEGKVAGVEIPSVEYWRPLLEDPGLRR